MSASDKSLRSNDFVKPAEADGFQYAVRLDDRKKLEQTIGEWLAFPGRPRRLSSIRMPGSTPWWVRACPMTR